MRKHATESRLSEHLLFGAFNALVTCPPVLLRKSRENRVIVTLIVSIAKQISRDEPIIHVQTMIRIVFAFLLDCNMLLDN